MKYEDLPPALKARVDAQLAETGQAPARRPKSRRQAPASSEPAGRCQCGEAMTATRWEKHSDALGDGHRRYLCDVGPVT